MARPKRPLQPELIPPAPRDEPALIPPAPRKKPRKRSGGGAATNKAKGKAADDLGKRWEDVVDKQHAAYRKQALADIHKIHTPMTIAGKCRYTNSGLQIWPAILRKRRSVDFYGVIQGGKCIRVECKATTSDTFKRSSVKDHQLDDLTRCVNLGGVAGFLVATIMGLWYLPLHGWNAHDRASFRDIDLDLHGVRLGTAEDARLVFAGLFTRPLDYLREAAAARRL